MSLQNSVVGRLGRATMRSLMWWRASESPRQLLSILAIAMTSYASPCSAQQVVSVWTEEVVIDSGEKGGVRIGATGRICANEVAGDNVVEVCYAEFVVTAVRQDSSTLRITQGDATDVRPGMRLNFYEPLARATVDSRISASGDPAPQELLKQADRLYDAEDFVGAAAAYKRFAARFPASESVDYAKRLAAICDAKASEGAQKPLEQDKVGDKESAVVLAKQARRLSLSGDWDGAVSKAQEALRLNAANAEALAVIREAELRRQPESKSGNVIAGRTGADGSVAGSKRVVESGPAPTARELAEAFEKRLKADEKYLAEIVSAGDSELLENWWNWQSEAKYRDLPIYKETKARFEAETRAQAQRTMLLRLEFTNHATTGGYYCSLWEGSSRLRSFSLTPGQNDYRRTNFFGVPETHASVSRESFALEPGRHELSLRCQLDYHFMNKKEKEKEFELAIDGNAGDRIRASFETSKTLWRLSKKSVKKF